jgi:hypothetical protein
LLQKQRNDEIPVDTHPLHIVRQEAFFERARDLGLIARRAGVPRTEPLARVAKAFADVWRSSSGIQFQEPELATGSVLRALVVVKRGAVNPYTGLAELSPRTMDTTDLAGDLADGKTAYGKTSGFVRLARYDLMGEEAYLLRLGTLFTQTAINIHDATLHFCRSPCQPD